MKSLSLNQAIRPIIKEQVEDTNIEAIKNYLVAGGEGMELTEKQKELLKRYTFADEMIRQNMGKLNRGDIANLIVTRFEVSLATAKSDMVAAEDVFSSSNPLNKKYSIGLRIERMEKIIRLATDRNEFEAVAKLEKVLVEYYKIYPDLQKKRPPRTVNFNFQFNTFEGNVLPDEQAEEILNIEAQNVDTLDHE